MSAQLKSSSQGHTLVLTISNPAQRNAMGPEIYAAGIEALGVAERTQEIHTVVLAGEGELFSGGGNLQRLQANRQQDASVQSQSIEAMHSWIEAIRTFPKPVIAAVEGFAAGAGFSLALACDLLVAARNAQFILSYANVGLSPDGGASWHLSQALPRQLVSEWLMCGNRVGAARLHELGLVNQLSEPGCAVQTALAWSEQLNRQAPNALASIKELIQEAPQSGLSAHLARERDHFVRNLHHHNAGIGIAAFLNKQDPQYE